MGNKESIKIKFRKICIFFKTSFLNSIQKLSKFIYNWAEYKNDTTIPNPLELDDLAPINNVESNSSNNYQKALFWALKNKRVKNMAITGSYGSGKSSIINTFIENNKLDFTFLNISLAAFGQKPETEKIEIAIFQQLHYTLDDSKLIHSRIKRIKNPKSINLFLKVLIWMCWLGSSLSLFFPKIIFSISVFKTFQISIENLLNHDLNLFLNLLISFGGLIAILMSLVRLIMNGKLSFSKVDLKNGGFEVSSVGDGKELSIFNKHLDEIFYVFQRTKYDVIFFEDLDRLENSEILVKLRELNILLNDAKQIKRKITFVYVIKDDVFKVSKERTKFFDFILPVIPIVNFSNSKELFEKRLTGLKKELSDIIKGVGFYIDDMRLIKNICNEFIIYKSKLIEEKSFDYRLDKLLAIIIYKNYYPNDFEKLHNKKGYLYYILNNKLKLVNDALQIFKKKETEIKTKIESLKTTSLANEVELRSLYMYALIRKVNNNQGRQKISAIRIEGQDHTIDTLINDPTLFEKLTTLTDITYIDNYYGSTYNLGTGFKKIEEESFDKEPYIDRVKYLISNRDKTLKEYNDELTKCINEKRNLYFTPLCDILKMDIDINSLEVKLEDNDLLVNLLREGYIAKDYEDYISLFHEGSLYENDKKFIISLRNNKSVGFDFELKQYKNILNEVSIEDCKKESILNFSLLEFLLNNKSEFKEHYFEAILVLSKNNSNTAKFIHQFKDITKSPDVFFADISDKWQSFWLTIQNNNSYTQDVKYDYLVSILNFADLDAIKKQNQKKSIVDFILNDADFLTKQATKISIEKLCEIIQVLEIKFIKIHNYRDVSPNLIKYIYENNCYQFNEHLIFAFIDLYNQESTLNIENLKTQNFSTIIKSDCKNLINYIEEEITAYVKNVFFEINTNKEEEASNVLRLINYEDDTMGIDTKLKIVLSQNTKHTDIEVFEEVLWSQVIENNKVEANWENVLKYYGLTNEINKSLLLFLESKENYDILKTSIIYNTLSILEDTRNSFEINLLNENRLSDDAYKSLLNSIDAEHSGGVEIEELDKEKIKAVIENGILSFEKDTFDKIKKKYSADTLHIFYLEKNNNKLLSTNFEIVDKEDTKHILLSKNINDEFKLKTINALKIEDYAKDDQLSSIVITSALDKSQIDHYISCAILISKVNFDAKIYFLVNVVNNNTKQEEIDEYLKTLPDQYKELTKHGGVALLDTNNYNQLLAEKLDNIGYISSYTINDKNIRCNLKRK